MTRKSQNRQQGSRRRGCSDKRGMVLGSLWDDDNDMILGQVADDRKRKGMEKISAVVDSGAEANALPKNMMQYSLKVREDLPRRWRRSHPCARREVGDRPNGRGTEPQDRLGSLRVLPRSQRPEIKSTWVRTRPSSRTTRQGKSRTSVESATCGCLTCG